MKRNSDQQHLTNLFIDGSDDPLNVYKAAIAVANAGSRLPDETKLSDDKVTLLEVRRLIFKSKFKEAEKLLVTVQTNDIFLLGDISFLKAQLCHKQGKQEECYLLMREAGAFYKEANDPYRTLRALVNGAISIATLESCLYGELLALEQEARRSNYHEIAANICRTRSMELLKSGNLSEAHREAMEAANLYRLDGYPDDRCVAIVIAAIALFMKGEKEEANETLQQCLIKEGKVKSYLEIYKTLTDGKVPKLPKGHPLEDVKWNKNSLKTQSVPGKIVEALKQQSRTKDELILYVWGNEATDVSYVGRLHTAVNYLRKSKNIDVKFDGEKYLL